MTKRTLRDVTSGETEFTPSGTLPPPSLLGRLIRLLFGLAIFIWLLPGLIVSIPNLSNAADIPSNPFFWFIVGLTFLNMNHVINLGLGKSWDHKPQLLFLATVGVALAVGVIGYGRFWAPPLATLLVLWLILINLPLGTAFLLAAVLRTPGCEMRSFNHLLAKIQGKNSTEHFCPGGVDFADRWTIKVKTR